MNITTSHVMIISHHSRPETTEGQLLVQRMMAEWYRLVNLRLLFEMGELIRPGTAGNQDATK